MEEEAEELVVEEDEIKRILFEYTITIIITALVVMVFMLNKQVKRTTIQQLDISTTQPLPTTEADHREIGTSLSDMDHELMSIIIQY